MITVVVSVYNTAKYLSKALGALQGQTYRDFEILIIDDGSGKEDADLCDMMARDADNIRVFHKSNGGLASARNYGIKKAAGEYIIFPDPDDWVEPAYLEKLMKGYDAPDTDLSVCGHYLVRNGESRVWNSGARKRVFDTASAMEEALSPYSFCGYVWNKLFRMDLIREHDLSFDEDIKVIQDLPFVIRYLNYCRKTVYDPVPLYYYSRDNGGATLFRKQLGEKELSGLKAYQRIAEYTQSAYPAVSEMAYAGLAERALRFTGIYYRTGMKEHKLLRHLHGIFRQHSKSFFACRNYTVKHKAAARIALISPRAYYFLVSRFGHMRGDR